MAHDHTIVFPRVFEGMQMARAMMTRPPMRHLLSLGVGSLVCSVLACGSPAPLSEPATPGGTDAGDERSSATPTTEQATKGATPASPTATTCAVNDAAPNCGPATEVATAGALQSLIDSLDWQPATPSKPHIYVATGDLVASADIDLPAKTLAAPVDPGCDSGALGRNCADVVFRTGTYVRYDATPTIANIACSGVPIYRSPQQGCAALHVPAGTRFRVRKVFNDVHPMFPTYVPIVELERPCTDACAHNELRCPATQTCLREGPAFCEYCEGKTSEACACRLRCGTAPDGTECGYDTSPDTIASGVCSAGRCAAAH